MTAQGWITEVAIANEAVGTAEIIDSGVTTAKLANDAVTAAKLAPHAAQAGYYGQTNVALYGSCYYG